MGQYNPFRGSPFGIMRLAEWWPTVIARDGFFYPRLTRIMDYFSSSPLNTLFYIGKNMKKSSRKSWIRWDATRWRHFDITMTSRSRSYMRGWPEPLLVAHSKLLEISCHGSYLRRKKHKLLLFYKMQHELCPEYLSSLITQLIIFKTDHSYKQFIHILSCIANHFYHQ